MQNSRDSSLFRGLARPLGDALAFGVGMKLAQTAGNRRDGKSEPGKGGAIEAAIESAVSDRIASSFDALRGEINAMQHDFARTLGSLLAEQVAKEVSERRAMDLGQLRGEIAQTQREFADAVGQIVTQQIESKLQAVSAAMDKRIGEHAAAIRADMVRIHESFAESMATLLSEQIESQVLSRAAAIQQALAEQIASAVTVAVREEALGIRKETASAQTAMADFLSAVGNACRDAAGKAVHAPTQAPVEETRPPEFPQLRKTGELLRIPLVSSFVLALGGVMLAHFL